MGAFPIHWRTGGISWGSFDGVTSLYVCWRFRDVAIGREARGFIVRFGKGRAGLYSASKAKVYFGCLRFQSYRRAK